VGEGGWGGLGRFFGWFGCVSVSVFGWLGLIFGFLGVLLVCLYASIVGFVG